MPYLNAQVGKEYGKRWRLENRDRVNARKSELRRAWRSIPANREAYNAAHRLERAKKMELEGRIARAVISSDFERWRHTILRGIKSRCKKSDIPFDLIINDLTVPEFCPVLGIPMTQQRGPRTDNSPSVDRIIPELGYIKSNIRIISFRANQLKHTGTLEELEAVAAYVRRECR